MEQLGQDLGYIWDVLDGFGGGRVIVVRARAVALLKPAAAILLGQLLYWQRRTTDAAGWFYNTQAELKEQTGLTLEELEAARTKLKNMGLLEEVKRGIPCRIFYRLDVVKVYYTFVNKQNRENPDTRRGDSPIQDAGFPLNSSIYNKDDTKSIQRVGAALPRTTREKPKTKTAKKTGGKQTPLPEPYQLEASQPKAQTTLEIIPPAAQDARRAASSHVAAPTTRPPNSRGVKKPYSPKYLEAISELAPNLDNERGRGLWVEWEIARAAKRKALSPELAMRQLGKLGKHPNPCAVLEYSLDAGYQGLFFDRDTAAPRAAKGDEKLAADFARGLDALRGL